MAEPLDPDREAGETPLPDSADSDEELTEDDLDIDALVSVWKDDLLLDAIGGAAHGSDRLDVPFDVSTDRQLVEALLNWRRGTESDLLAPVGPDEAPNTPLDPDDSSPPRHRFRVPLVSALAAAVMITFTALAAYGSAPDEALWPVTEILYSQHAASIQAADDADTAQARAQAALAAGKTREAEAALSAAAGRIPQVRSQDGQTKLQDRQRDLERQLKTPPAAGVPRKSASEPGTPSRTTSAAAKPTSQRTTHSSRSESPSARANEAPVSSTDAEFATTTTTPARPSPHPTSASSTSRPDREQPGKPPQPTRSATPTTPRPAPSAPRTGAGAPQDRAHRAEPVTPSSRKSPSTTPQPQATSVSKIGETVELSPSARATAKRRAQADHSASAAPTSQRRAPAAPEDD
jgi:hypothetical protein